MSGQLGKASFLHYGSEKSLRAGSNTMMTERKILAIDFLLARSYPLIW